MNPFGLAQAKTIPPTMRASAATSVRPRRRDHDDKRVAVDSIAAGTAVVAEALINKGRSSGLTMRCGTGYRERNSATGLKVVVKVIISTRSG